MIGQNCKVEIVGSLEKEATVAPITASNSADPICLEGGSNKSQRQEKLTYT